MTGTGEVMRNPREVLSLFLLLALGTNLHRYLCLLCLLLTDALSLRLRTIIGYKYHLFLLLGSASSHKLIFSRCLCLCMSSPIAPQCWRASNIPVT